MTQPRAAKSRAIHREEYIANELILTAELVHAARVKNRLHAGLLLKRHEAKPCGNRNDDRTV